jgi:hypothetical protein
MLGSPEYRWRWYNFRWSTLRKGRLNQRLWPALELAVRSGLLGSSQILENPAMEIDVFHAFNRKIHGRYVRSIGAVLELLPHNNIFRFDMPLGIDGEGLNTNAVYSVTDANGGTTKYTRYQANKIISQSIKLIDEVLAFHDELETRIAPHFFLWLCDNRNIRFEDLQSSLPIGKAGNDFLKVCDLVEIPEINHPPKSAVYIAEHLSVRDDEILAERETWSDYEHQLSKAKSDNDSLVWPTTTVEPLLSFSRGYQSVLNEALLIRREKHREYLQDSDDLLSELEEGSGLSHSRDND